MDTTQQHVELPSLYQEFIHKSKYSRWIESKDRRETWNETCTRYVSFFAQHVEKNTDSKLTECEISDMKKCISSLDVMPSMRAFMTAGPALERDNVAGYNCSYMKINRISAFDELLYVLMCGTGVGFSVERQYISKLPTIPTVLHNSKTMIHIHDSKIGWAKGLKELVTLLYTGTIPKWNMSDVRDKGKRLKIFGGRSSGPKPLTDLFNFVTEKFKNAAGRKLQSIEAHDICCKIAEIVIVGGVRRCIAKGSMVTTQKGSFKYIEDIDVGDIVSTNDGWKPVTATFKQGEQKTVSIVHSNGNIVCTPNHRVAILKGMDGSFDWKEARLVKPGDRLLYIEPDIAEVGCDGSFDWKDERAIETDNKVLHVEPYIVIPKLNEETSWLIGHTHINGEIKLTEMEGSIIINTSRYNTDQISFISNQFTRFNVNVCIKSKCIVVSNLQLATYFNDLKHSDVTIQVPRCIRNGTRKIKLSFVRGIFHANINNHVKQLISSTNKELVREIQNILYSIGIVSRISSDSTNKWVLTIVHNFDIAKFNADQTGYIWNKLPVNQTDVHDDSFPMHIFDYMEDKTKTQCEWFQKSNDNIPLSVWRRHFKDGRFVPMEVFEINDHGSTETYDIEVEGNHNFLCEGIIVHNSALISLSNLSDERMRSAKTGNWWVDSSQRALSNNSVCYTEKPDMGRFMREWIALYESKSGERGIFNRDACEKHLENKCVNRKRSFDNDSSKKHEFGTNPCVPATTIVMTTKGSKKVIDLIDTPFVAVVDGKPYECKTGFFFTGVKQTFMINTNEGFSVSATENHKFLTSKNLWVELKNLRIGDILRMHLHSALLYTTISDITIDKKCNVYDCTVPGPNAFDANGFYVHNCCEIILRDMEFCNLSEVVIRANDTRAIILRKVELATIIGTLQSTLTNFRYIDPSWKFNCDDERLLGVSVTGIMDNKFMSTPSTELKTFLNEMRDHAIAVNKKWAARLGINASAAITCVKPSGTVSQLCDTASGIHARHSAYYIRTVRSSNNDKLCDFMKNAGVPSEQCFMNPDTTTIFSFPIKSPDDCVTRDDITAIEQLELVNLYNQEYTQHKVSVTITVKEHEWLAVGAWVYDHFETIGGVSFLPQCGTTYKQMPYQECSKETYDAALFAMPKNIDWNTLNEYDDLTEGAKTFACVAGGCEMI
jgi:intein/homing endonuclease